MIRYIGRDGAGNIIRGSYAQPQPGLAEEAIDDADPAFIAANAPPPPPYVPPSPLDWFLRLPQATQANLDMAARTDTAVSLALRYASGVVSIIVSDPRTIQNVELLFSKGLITAAEKALLLAP